MQGSSTPRGPLAARAIATDGVAFHLTQRCRRPDLVLFRGSIACLHVPLANASTTPLRPPPHGSGPPWLARPSGRGRNRPSRITPLGRPPAQTPACSIRAPGSYLSCRTSAPGRPRRAGSRPLHPGPLSARVNQRRRHTYAGSESGEWFAGHLSPWFGPFRPPPPPQPGHARVLPGR